MITTQEIKDSLTIQTECPKCGADWQEIENALYEQGDDYYIALQVIRNCPVCGMRFERIKK